LFFHGFSEFTRRNLAASNGSGAIVIDLSGGIAARQRWLRGFEAGRITGREFKKNHRQYFIPSAAATAAAVLASRCRKTNCGDWLSPSFQPVSESGRGGSKNWKAKTGQLLSFSGCGSAVFDTQRCIQYGRPVWSRERAETGRDPGAGARGNASKPREEARCRDQVVHAPVFYGTAFAAWAELEPALKLAKSRALAAMRLLRCLRGVTEGGPSNVGATGERSILLAKPEADPAQPGTGGSGRRQYSLPARIGEIGGDAGMRARSGFCAARWFSLRSRAAAAITSRGGAIRSEEHSRLMRCRR